MEILLRRFNSKDLEELHKYAKVKGVFEAAGHTRHKTKAESKELLDKYCKDRRVFAITVDGVVQGSVLLKRTTRPELLPDVKFEELEVIVSKEYWGNTIGVVAVSLIQGYGFDNLKLDAIIATPLVDNKQAIRVLEKCKFNYNKDLNVDDVNYKLYIINKPE